MTPLVKSPLMNAKEAIDGMTFGQRIRPVDATWFMNGVRSADSEFLNARLQNAVRFDIDTVKDLSTPLPHMLPPPEVMQKWVDKAGIVRSSDTVLVYAQPGSFSAARVWWTFRAYGFSAAILQGSITAWTQAGGPIETGPVAEPALRPHAPDPVSLNPQYVVSMQEVKNHTELKTGIVLDARSAERFNGKVPEPRAGLERSHIPHSVNLPFSDLLQDDYTKFKSKEEIERIFEKVGVDYKTDSLIIPSCGSGVSACVLVAGLEIVGRPAERTPVYDGSWAEWGAKADTVKEL